MTEIKHITIKEITEYTPSNEPALYITSKRDVADYLTSKGEAVCICVNSEEQLPAFEGYKYFITEDVQYSGHMDMVYCHIKNIPYVIGEDEDFIIREECPEDLPKIYDMYDDEECKRFLESLPELSDALTPEARFESVKNGYMLFEYGMWIIELKETNEVIGRVGFEYFNESAVSLGFMIRKDMRNKGYALKAVINCITYLKANHPELKIIARVSSKNKASLNLLSKTENMLPGSIKVIVI
jgi:RimJ/RimL family protein N-acetyltransferase